MWCPTIQMFIGNVIEPKMLGDSLDLHPITVLLSLIFWGMLWGIPGMLLAAPITAVLKILSENLEVTAPVARLLSGKLSAQPKTTDPEPTPAPPLTTADLSAKPTMPDRPAAQLDEAALLAQEEPKTEEAQPPAKRPSSAPLDADDEITQG